MDCRSRKNMLTEYSNHYANLFACIRHRTQEKTAYDKV